MQVRQRSNKERSKRGIRNKGKRRTYTSHVVVVTHVNLTVNEVVGRSRGEGGDEEVKGRLEETRGSREEVGILYPCLGETTSRRSSVNFVPPLPLPPPLPSPPLVQVKVHYFIQIDTSPPEIGIPTGREQVIHHHSHKQQASTASQDWHENKKISR